MRSAQVVSACFLTFQFRSPHYHSHRVVAFGGCNEEGQAAGNVGNSNVPVKRAKDIQLLKPH